MTEDELSIYNRGISEGIKHQKMSPETEQEITELKAEWLDFKRVSRNILIGALVPVVGYGVWVGTIQSKINEFTRYVEVDQKMNEDIRGKIQSTEISNADIRARLINIESTLLEIKQGLKK